MGAVDVLHRIERCDHARHVYMPWRRLLDQDAAHAVVVIELHDQREQLLRGRLTWQAMVLGVDAHLLGVLLFHAHVLR
jgi:hypothetical protein